MENILRVLCVKKDGQVIYQENHISISDNNDNSLTKDGNNTLKLKKDIK